MVRTPGIRSATDVSILTTRPFAIVLLTGTPITKSSMG
jgi:hypothetical protein